MYSHHRSPNDPRPDCRSGGPFGNLTNELWDRLGLDAPPRSAHPGGVNVLFADGRVAFIKDTIDSETWSALGTRAGSELV